MTAARNSLHMPSTGERNLCEIGSDAPRYKSASIA